MRLRRLRAAAIAAVTMCLMPSSAHAQFTTYNTLAAYLAAVTAPGTDTFNDLSTLDVTASPLLRTAGLYTYRASASEGFFAAGTTANAWLSTDVSDDAIVFDLFSPTVRGVGGLFFGSDINGQFLAGTTITLTATNAGGSLQQVLTNTTTSTFFGFVSNIGAITSLTVAATQPPSSRAWPTVDNLVLAALPTPITAVPEPGTYALLAAGLAVLGGFTRRRRC